MAKSQKELAKPVGPSASPAWLAERAAQDEGLGMDAARQNRVMQRIIVVQGTSGNDLLTLAGAGGLVTRPDNRLLLEVGPKGASGTLDIIPIATYTTWQKRADNRDKESAWIIEESFDPTSKIARLAANPATRRERYGPDDDREYAYCEAMNWVWQIAECPANPDMVGRLAIATFAIGELYAGKKFASHLCDAYPPSEPIFVKRVRVTTSRRERNGNAWWGIDVAAEQVEKYIEAGQYDDLKTKHLAVAEMIQSRTLVGENPATADAD